MRPVRLEVKGFTAYRESQVLDFEDLDLFAITGPTGSGKSSLLDAVTYALYGRAPRIGNRAGLLIAQGQPRLAVKRTVSSCTELLCDSLAYCLWNAVLFFSHQSFARSSAASRPGSRRRPHEFRP